METAYKPEVCDLCCSKKYQVLLELKTGHTMRSGRRIVRSNLGKYVRDNCGLVRSGQCFDNQSLEDYYSDEYGLSEHSLACAYSNVGDFPVVCGLDYNPDKPEYAALDFPVLKPEDCLAARARCPSDNEQGLL